MRKKFNDEKGGYLNGLHKNSRILESCQPGYNYSQTTGTCNINCGYFINTNGFE